MPNFTIFSVIGSRKTLLNSLLCSVLRAAPPSSSAQLIPHKSTKASQFFHLTKRLWLQNCRTFLQSMTEFRSYWGCSVNTFCSSKPATVLTLLKSALNTVGMTASIMLLMLCSRHNANQIAKQFSNFASDIFVFVTIAVIFLRCFVTSRIFCSGV